MSSHVLDVSYTILGRTFSVHTKAGRYELRRKAGNYEFSHDNGREVFWISPSMDLVGDIGLEPGDRVSLASFDQEYGSLFLLLNHRNSRHAYYPAAVQDLFWHFDAGLLMDFLVDWRLRRAARSFAHTAAFRAVLQTLQQG